MPCHIHAMRTMLAVMMPSRKITHNVPGFLPYLYILKLHVHEHRGCRNGRVFFVSLFIQSTCPGVVNAAAESHRIIHSRRRRLEKGRFRWYVLRIKLIILTHGAYQPGLRATGGSSLTTPHSSPRHLLLVHTHYHRVTAEPSLSTWPQPSPGGRPRPSPSTLQSCRSPRPP